jgi:hypothetical protein
MRPRAGRCHGPACRRIDLHRHLAIRITRDGELVVRDCREETRERELTRAETGNSSAELIHYGQVRTSHCFAQYCSELARSNASRRSFIGHWSPRSARRRGAGARHSALGGSSLS